MRSYPTVNDLNSNAKKVATERLNARVADTIDLALMTKQAHWNLKGPQFIAVHEMLDPQVAAVRAMVDETAERIATLGVSPRGTPGRLVAERTWEDYAPGRADAMEHLRALDQVYDGFCGSHRHAIVGVTEIDPASQDMLIGQLRELEKFQWFIRAHLARAGAPG